MPKVRMRPLYAREDGLRTAMFHCLIMVIVSIMIFLLFSFPFLMIRSQLRYTCLVISASRVLDGENVNFCETIL